MRALAVLLLSLVAACSHVNYSSTAATTPGIAVSSSGGGLHVQGGRPLVFIILGSALIATGVDGEPRPLMFSDSMGMRPAPEMSPDREIAEQDCTKPIELSGNLKCR